MYKGDALASSCIEISFCVHPFLYLMSQGEIENAFLCLSSFLSMSKTITTHPSCQPSYDLLIIDYANSDEQDITTIKQVIHQALDLGKPISEKQLPHLGIAVFRGLYGWFLEYFYFHVQMGIFLIFEGSELLP